MAWAGGVNVEQSYLRLKEWFFENVEDLFELTDEEFLVLIGEKVRGVQSVYYTEEEARETRERITEFGQREKWSSEMLSAKLKDAPNVGDMKWDKEMSDASADNLRRQMMDWFNEVKESGVDVSELFEGEEL